MLGRFSSRVGFALTSALQRDRTLGGLASGVGDAELEQVLAKLMPSVAMLDEQSVTDLSLPLRLRSALPRIALVVLARQPTRAYCVHVLGLGASACLSEDTPVAKIVSAVRLVSDGASPPLAATKTNRSRADPKPLGIRQQNSQRG